MPKNEDTKIWTKVDKTGSCWLWQGVLYPNGYGRIRFRGREEYTHRVSYILAHGPILAGMSICHKCDVRNCVNPDHLFMGTQKDNMADMVSKSRQAPPDITKRVGTDNGRSVLSESDVLAIRRNFVYTRGIYQKLALKYSVTPEMIGNIIRRSSWTHI